MPFMQETIVEFPTRKAASQAEKQRLESNKLA